MRVEITALQSQRYLPGKESKRVLGISLFIYLFFFFIYIFSFSLEVTLLIIFLS